MRSRTNTPTLDTTTSASGVHSIPTLVAPAASQEQDMDAITQSALRAAQDALHAQNEELVVTRNLLSRERAYSTWLVTHSSDAYLACDLQGRVRAANDAAFALFGDLALADGRPVTDLVQPHERAKLCRLFMAVTLDQEVIVDELFTRNASGAGIIVCGSLRRDPADSGTIPSVTCWLREATDEATPMRSMEAEHRKLELQLEREQQARADAEAEINRKDEALAVVAHELRSPLSSVSGWLRVLNDNRSEPQFKARALLSITRAIRSLMHLLDDLLDSTRFDRGLLTLTPGHADIPKLLAQVLEELAPAARAHDLELELFCEASSFPIHGDARRLLQVFRSLAYNAVSFTPNGGTVTLAFAHDERDVHVVVRDTGCGLSADVRAKLFQPFVRAQSDQRGASGLGLGLYIARQLVELHGGHIEAGIVKPRGASFHVRLPIGIRA